ncbi:MAG: helix-turn-helix domain-containing protein [Oscillospiraceae bacterium]|nr:helix-turn-helix domain-containing protein [Oscillospiraceae bacterium]
METKNEHLQKYPGRRSLNNGEVPVICQKIKLYREQIGLEQKTLAAEIGVISNAVSNWENGRSRPDIALLPKICQALDVSMDELFDMPVKAAEEKPVITAGESKSAYDSVLDQYLALSPRDQSVISSMIEKLREIEDNELYDSITEEIKFTKQLAAGYDPGCEFDDMGETIYLYKNKIHPRMDCIFQVSGDSMEPDFHNGDHVMVQRLSQQSELIPGEIGAFIFGNETYIKQYQKSGLRSLNKKYKMIKFTEEDSVFIIGRVLGVLPEDAVVSLENSIRYENAKKRIES